MTRGKVTRDDVARAAGTSVAVVSYVVNNGPRPVAAETKRRVLEAIEQTGYRPDGVARALASGSTRTFGLIVPNIANPFLAALAHAIEDQAYKSGYSIMLGDSGNNTMREVELVNTFMQHKIDGLMFYGVDRQHPWLDQATGRVPVVVLDEPTSSPGSACVRVDERAAAAAATSHLVEHGYQTIATVTGPLDQRNARDRRDGWRDALEAAGRQAGASQLVEADFTRRGGFLAAREIFAWDQRPDAVFLANEQQAIGFLAAADGHGVRVPDDIAVICFNGTSNAEYTIPALSTVEQPLDELAGHAIQLLEQRRSIDDQPTVVCDFTLLTRRSCGCEHTRIDATNPASMSGVLA